MLGSNRGYATAPPQQVSMAVLGRSEKDVTLLYCSFADGESGECIILNITKCLRYPSHQSEWTSSFLIPAGSVIFYIIKKRVIVIRIIVRLLSREGLMAN